jgi:methylated-DNA-protein-cysteine methyltransferase-like protein
MGVNVQTSSLKEAIWQIVAAIPEGNVATYGQVAMLAGYPNHARYVGTTLKNLPKGTRLPWHRVINSRGKLSFPMHSAPWQKQRARLEKEGILFSGKGFPLKHYQWQT